MIPRCPSQGASSTRMAGRAACPAASVHTACARVWAAALSASACATRMQIPLGVTSRLYASGCGRLLSSTVSSPCISSGRTVNPAAVSARIAVRPSSLWLVAESTLMPPCRRKPGLRCSTEICRGWGMMAGSISTGAEGRALDGENSTAAAVASPHRRR